jgi:hypothetical protein
VENKKWYYVKAGKSEGPVSLDVLEDLIKTGQITRDTPVWNNENYKDNGWVRASETELEAIFSAISASDTPPPQQNCSTDTPGKKSSPKLKISVGFGALLLIFVVLFFWWDAKHTMHLTGASVVEMLREVKLELVTDKITTMVSCTFEEVAENSKATLVDMAFGKGEAVLIAKVVYLYGLNLEKITERNVDVSVEKKTITITLPEPELLQYSVDWDRTYYSKTPLLRKFYNYVVGENQQKIVEGAFLKKAKDYAKANGLEPSKSDIIARLGSHLSKILGNTDMQIVFK